MSLDEMLAEAIEAAAANDALSVDDEDTVAPEGDDKTVSLAPDPADDPEEAAADAAEIADELEALRNERDDMRDRFMRALGRRAENAHASGGETGPPRGRAIRRFQAVARHSAGA